MKNKQILNELVRMRPALFKLYKKRFSTIPQNVAEFDDAYSSFYIKLTKANIKGKIKNPGAFITTGFHNHVLNMYREYGRFHQVGDGFEVHADYILINFDTPENNLMRTEFSKDVALAVMSSDLPPKVKARVVACLKTGGLASAAREIGISNNLMKVTWYVWRDKVKDILKSVRHNNINMYGLSANRQGGQDVRVHCIAKG